MTPRIPPKNGFVFTPGNVIRLEFPAQVKIIFNQKGYVNPSTTTLSFDVSLVVPNPGFTDPTPANGVAVGKQAVVRFQNNVSYLIYCRFKVFSQEYVCCMELILWRILLITMVYYFYLLLVVVRNLTEWTAGNPSFTMDQGTITDGIGNNTMAITFGAQAGLLNTRANMVQGCAFGRDTTGPLDTSIGRGLIGVQGVQPAGVLATPSLAANDSAGAPVTAVPTVVVTRRYQVQLALGLMTQEKLIPTKYMASQLAIELTLETPANCIVADLDAYTASPATAGYVNGWQSAITYCVFNVNLIPEILEFDASYDTAFLQGLQNGGVPIKFSSWHTFLFSSASAANVNLLIQERSRSVKSIFTVQRLGQPDITIDNGATFFDTSLNLLNQEGSTLQNYQYRVGGRYFPAAPVQCSTNTGSGFSNGGAEAYTELAKALNILGDFRLSTACNATRWGVSSGVLTAGAANTILQNADYGTSIKSFDVYGKPIITKTVAGGDLGSACFAAAVSLETSNGIEISGLNAEEQVLGFLILV